MTLTKCQTFDTHKTPLCCYLFENLWGEAVMDMHEKIFHFSFSYFSSVSLKLNFLKVSLFPFKFICGGGLLVKHSFFHIWGTLFAEEPFVVFSSI